MARCIINNIGLCHSPFCYHQKLSAAEAFSVEVRKVKIVTVGLQPIFLTCIKKREWVLFGYGCLLDFLLWIFLEPLIFKYQTLNLYIADMFFHDRQANVNFCIGPQFWWPTLFGFIHYIVSILFHIFLKECFLIVLQQL